MKCLYLIMINFLLIKVANSQTISPVTTNEYCPNTEYTFTVTIPKSYSSISTLGGCYVTQSPTSPVGSTFTFKGKFADANLKQTFRVNYTDGTNYNFEFKKIKSLYYTTAFCSQIQKPLTTITAPSCQVTNIPVSFPAIKWNTAFEPSEFCFGSVSTYEYLLPAGWSIGANVSTGSNWIAGSNNATITSDLNSGNGGYVQIRPSNSPC